MRGYGAPFSLAVYPMAQPGSSCELPVFIDNSRRGGYFAAISSSPVLGSSLNEIGRSGANISRCAAYQCQD